MTQETAREWFKYDPETGVLTWRKSPAWSVCAGREAGCVVEENGGKSYRTVRLKGCLTYAHTIIWLWMTGHWPVKPEEVDHQDGNGTNNRWKNLRLVGSHLEQCRNKRLYKNNKTGVVGVHFAKREGKYEACVRVEGRLRHLGYFPRLEDAVAARAVASKKHGFHRNHGQDRPL